MSEVASSDHSLSFSSQVSSSLTVSSSSTKRSSSSLSYDSSSLSSTSDPMSFASSSSLPSSSSSSSEKSSTGISLGSQRSGFFISRPDLVYCNCVPFSIARLCLSHWWWWCFHFGMLSSNGLIRCVHGSLFRLVKDNCCMDAVLFCRGTKLTRSCSSQDLFFCKS